MPLFIAQIHHPEEEGWRRHLRAHIDYLRERLAEGSLTASRALVGTPVRAGLLILSAETREAALAIMEADPFWTEGLVEDMTLVEWDPIFGAFSALSNRPAFGQDGEAG